MGFIMSMFIMIYFSHSGKSDIPLTPVTGTRWQWNFWERRIVHHLIYKLSLRNSISFDKIYQSTNFFYFHGFLLLCAVGRVSNISHGESNHIRVWVSSFYDCAVCIHNVLPHRLKGIHILHSERFDLKTNHRYHLPVK